MRIDHLAIAVQGIGYQHTTVASQGFLVLGDTVQVALEVIQLITSVINPSLLSTNLISVNALQLHSSAVEPFFVGMLQIIRRGLKIHVTMTDDLIIPIKLVDSNE